MVAKVKVDVARVVTRVVVVSISAFVITVRVVSDNNINSTKLATLTLNQTVLIFL